MFSGVSSLWRLYRERVKEKAKLKRMMGVKGREGGGTHDMGVGWSKEGTPGDHGPSVGDRPCESPTHPGASRRFYRVTLTTRGPQKLGWVVSFAGLRGSWMQNCVCFLGFRIRLPFDLSSDRLLLLVLQYYSTRSLFGDWDGNKRSMSDRIIHAPRRG